jgi:hypothetical protein
MSRLLAGFCSAVGGSCLWAFFAGFLAFWGLTGMAEGRTLLRVGMKELL